MQIDAGEVASGSRTHDPDSLPVDECSVCMAIHLAATGLLPPPPITPAFSEFDRAIPQSPLPVFSLDPAKISLFRTRAPPAT